ncbi:MAG: 2-dehydro-3-deoxyphosphogluconate aldolase/(4S)-4-hydroxy-2-oxoglutarate aldolase [Cellvibrionaceae bacterium]|jgi:2-dehydro-3-deoxyphosphogluconate aldolase/(4S)-4-hydroxy-2-oxoglutarate aldolase
MSDVMQRLGEIGIVPVVAIKDAADAADLGHALVAGNLPCAEITFRTPAAAEAIRQMSAACPDMCVGAGTVLTVAQAEVALANGAQFIVTPGFDGAIVDWCLANDMPIVPGVMTPTEINMALNKGLEVVKFFPAEIAGGVKALKAIGAPYGNVRFMPTGGINPANLPDYLALPNVVACGGSWMVKNELINGRRFDEISQLSQAGINIVQKTRDEK